MRAGLGRNAIARKRGISPGSVSNIAREIHHSFERCVDTATATEAHQIDMAFARVQRAEQAWTTYLATPARRRDGRETRRARKASYQLYDIDRKHNGRYPV